MLHAVAYSDQSRASIVAFIETMTDGYIDWADLVLAHLIAGPEAVCDLWRGTERVGVGVSLDNCESEGDTAELSVFFRPGDNETLEALLDWGERRIASVGRTHIDIAMWPGVVIPSDLLQTRGFRTNHRVFDMERPPELGAPAPPRTPLPEGWRWHPFDERYLAAFHNTARLAFDGVPSAFVPDDPGTFAERQRAADPAPSLLISTDSDTSVAAFLRVETRNDGIGVLGILARHPKFHGLGLGAHLVHRGISWLRDLEAPRVRLDVASSNRAGLTLYESFGFQITQQREVMRRRLQP